MSSILRFLICAASVAISFASSPPQRIYLAPDDHTDYMWTADEETYRKEIVRMIGYYLDLADATAANPPDRRSRWNCDGSLWMWLWEKNRSPSDFDRFVRQVRSGHMTVPLNVTPACFGGAPAEAILRGMYYPGHIERRYGIRFPLAIAMEDQTLPYGLGALWAGAGARYSWRGVCGCATMLKSTIKEPRPHEIYWWVGPDKSRILMKWNSLFTENKSLGGYAEAYDPVASLQFVEENQEFHARYPYNVVGIFGKGWDDLSTTTDQFVRVASEFSTPARRVIVSNEEDFFRDFEANYGANLPSETAAYGNEWDLYSASMAEVSAQVRRAVEKLRAAEAMATLVSLRSPVFMAGREEARDKAWMGLGLYWEHGWTADSPKISKAARAEWQRKVASEIERYVDGLYRDAARGLGSLMRGDGTQTRFFVFNALGEKRTDVVDLPYEGTGPVHVVDVSTGVETPSQFMETRQRDGAAARSLRILAADVPSVGYKVFEVANGAGRAWPPALSASGNTLENEFYRLELDGRGAITRLTAKATGREWASTINGRAINDLGSGAGVVRVVNAGPVSATLEATADGPIQHRTSVTLARGGRRVEIANEITANFADVQTWAFSFNLRAPDVMHEEIGAINRARLAADGGAYAERLSRLDWLTLNHFAAMSGAGCGGITLSNADCAFMKLGRSEVRNGVSHLDTVTAQISVLAGGQVDGPELGIPKQGGDSYFLQRFALEPYDHFDAAASMRSALRHQNPLVAGVVTGGGSYPATSYSLVSISDPNVLLWALKPAEEGIGHGIIARVWNLSAKDTEVRLALDGGIKRARAVSHIETDTGDASVPAGKLVSPISSWQLRSWRLERGSSGKN